MILRTAKSGTNRLYGKSQIHAASITLLLM